MNSKLYRCPDDVMIAGVCSGLGKYLEVNPAYVRSFFVLLALANGIGVFVYLLLWAIIPREDCGPDTTLGKTANDAANEIAEKARMMGDELRQSVSRPHPHTMVYIGAALIIFGIATLVVNLNPALLGWLNTGLLWAALLIVAGIFLLVRSRRM